MRSRRVIAKANPEHPYDVSISLLRTAGIACKRLMLCSPYKALRLLLQASPHNRRQQFSACLEMIEGWSVLLCLSICAFLLFWLLRVESANQLELPDTLTL